MIKVLERLLSTSNNRIDLWVEFINENSLCQVVEIGIYRGDFAEKVLRECPIIQKYYMIDPWEHLDDWNKPANKDSILFESYYQETIE